VQNITNLLRVVGFVALSAASTTFAAGDPEAGAQLNAQCQGCHGITGFKTAFPTVYSVPKIGGQNYDYLVIALKAYRDGDRTNETMHAIASNLSDQDINDLAAYYSGD
tara:strand:- start:16148 stop:16471 length:324 start_codon:yes stop_codon:yes gene_type:complete